MVLSGLDVQFTASASATDNCICDCCHSVGKVIKLQIPETKYFDGRGLSTKYSGLWVCENCCSKLAVALGGCLDNG